MVENKNKISKAFVLAGGKGKRIQLEGKQNLKAFIEIDNEQLLRRHIRQINCNLRPEKIYIMITGYEDLFEQGITDFNNVSLIYNEKHSDLRGLELLFAIKKIHSYLNETEKVLITLVDEYYDSDDFQRFCEEIFKEKFSVLAAIKQFTFPEEYSKNYAVVIDKKYKTIRNSIEKSDIKVIPEMLNLLGCSKEDFLKLIKKMNYSSFSKNEDTYFKYLPSKNNKKEFSAKVTKKENPFSVLKNINFK